LREGVRCNYLVASDITHLWKSDAGSSFWNFSGNFDIADSIVGKKGLVGEQKVRNCMGVSINPRAALGPFTHDRKSKMMNALDMIRMLPVSIHKVLHTREQNIEVGRNSSCATA
jgi:hypothetical protein